MLVLCHASPTGETVRRPGKLEMESVKTDFSTNWDIIIIGLIFCVFDLWGTVRLVGVA